MTKLIKLALAVTAVVAQEYTTTEPTTVNAEAEQEAIERAAQEARAAEHAAAEAAAQAAELAARIAGSCWTCGVMNNVTDSGPQDDATEMYGKCISEGELVDCMDERTTCSVVERRDGSGWVMSIEAGCKARDACTVNQAANFAYSECQREEGKPSKCVDCCLVADGDCLDRFSLYIDAADALDLDASVTAAWNNTLPEEVEEEGAQGQEEEEVHTCRDSPGEACSACSRCGAHRRDRL